MRPSRDLSRTFQSRLAAQVRGLVRTTGGLALLTLGCADKEEDSVRPTDAEICAGELPEGWTTGPVYISVPIDTPCPTNPTVEDTTHPSCCTPEVTEVVCSYSYSDEDQTRTTYGFQPSEDPTVDVCWYNAAFSQTESYACCGRPLMSGGRAVVAGTQNQPKPRRRRVAAPERVGAFWRQTALAEHASIGSFAKFSLDLLRLGAPASLLADAARAGLDEVAHAQAAFRLANQLLDVPVSPGPLPLDDTRDLGGPETRREASPTRIAVALVREGCVGETLAVLDAAERLAYATEPSVRRVLQRVIADESRHAALAWRALGWILRQYPEVEGAVQAAFVEEAARLFAEPVAPPRRAEPVERAWGLPDAARQSEVFREGWSSVIRSSLDGLSAGRAPGSRPKVPSRRAPAVRAG